MKKYLNGELGMTFEGQNYLITYNASFVSENGRWLENDCSYNVYRDYSYEVEEKNVLDEAIKSLQMHFWSVL